MMKLMYGKKLELIQKIYHNTILKNRLFQPAWILLFLFLIIFLLSINFSFSQEPDKEYFSSFYRDNKTLLGAPARWEISDFWKAGLFAGTVYFLTTQDGEINNFFQSYRSAATNNISELVRPLGNGLVVIGMESTWYAISRMKKDGRSQHIALVAVKTTTLTAVYGFAIKHLTHRSRPFQNHNYKEWEGPFGNTDYTSFPSGHSLFSFGLATIISEQYHNRWVSAGAYTLATIISLSRIHDEKHWMSDVVTGAILGTVIARTIYNKNKWKVETTPSGMIITF